MKAEKIPVMSEHINHSPDSLIRKYHSFLKLEKSLSQNSIEAYEDDLHKWLAYLADARLDYKQAELKHLRDFLVDLQEVGISVRSQARIISGVKSFYKFLLIEEVIESDPSELLELPRLGRKIPEVLALEEIDSIIDSIDLATREGQRNRAIIEMLYSCGLRVSELINLTFSNIYREEEYLRIIGKGDKQRLVPVSQRALDEVARWSIDRNALDIKKGSEDFVFLNLRGSRISRISIFNIVKTCAEKAGIRKNISPHTFRHSFATHLLEGGANLRVIQQMLGHQSIQTTEIYAHTDITFLRETIEMCHPYNKAHR
jgi:integrase/recombinase XerD